MRKLFFSYAVVAIVAVGICAVFQGFDAVVYVLKFFATPFGIMALASLALASAFVVVFFLAMRKYVDEDRDQN